MFISPAYAQAANSTAQSDGFTAMIVNFGPLVLIFVVFWFLVFRPQQQRQKEQRAKLEAVKRGDQVITGGGLLGKVTKVDGDQVEVELAPNVKVKALKAMLADVVSPTTGKAAND